MAHSWPMETILLSICLEHGKVIEEILNKLKENMAQRFSTLSMGLVKNCHIPPKFILLQSPGLYHKEKEAFLRNSWGGIEGN